ncbi:MAG: TonB-dependent receptor [Bacteroidales bacterium]
MKKFLTGILALLLFAPFATAQNRQISGKIVSSEDGLPVIGATVQDKATGRYAVSDVDGVFSIEVGPNSKVLSFACISFRDLEMPVAGSTMEVVMQPDVMALDEVMVIAYGQGKKTSFTGSASVVKKEDLERIPTSNITKALQGLSTGVQVINNSGQPGESASIMIRGIGSMNASSSPLYVVDGVPYGGYINAIAPSDIESMTVLKDASATALYGSRAANGVIVITTRRGQREQGQISFRSSIGFSTLAVDMPRQLTPQEFTELSWRGIYYEAMDNGYAAADAAQLATNNLLNEIKINPWNTSKPVGTDGKLAADADLLFEGDWRNALLQSRPRQEYTLDFSGKTDKTSYFFSGGYVNDKGIFTTQQFNRITGRANVTTKVKSWLEVGTNTSFAHSLTDAPASSDYIWFLRTIPSIYPVYEWDYSANAYKTDSDGNKIYDYGNDRKSWIGWNALADAAYNKYITKVDNIATRNFAEITFIPELKLRTTLSLDYYLSSYSGYTSATYGYMAGRGAASKSTTRSVTTTWTNLLTYDKTFGKHGVSVLLGQESYQRVVNGLSGSKEGFPFGGLYELGSAATMTDLTSYEDNYRLMSWFSRAEYDFDNKYYISGSIRADGSSRFHPNSRWGSFWSLGASWRMSNENFLKEISWIDNLKLKASYGAVGNDGLSSWYSYQGLYATGYDDFGKAGVMIERLPNETLKWETNLQFNAGVDFALFNKLTGSFEFFNRKSKDLLFTLPMAPSTGFSGIDRNIGDVQNRGVELQLSWRVMDRENFKWSMDFNATHYKNTITKLPQDEMNSGVFKWREGQSRYNFWGAEWAGVNPQNGNDQWWKNVYKTNEQGERVVSERVLTENFNEVSGDEQKTYLGDAIPKVFGGYTNTFNFYGIDFSFMIYFSIGGKLYDSDYSQMIAYREGFSYHPDILNSWTESNTGSNIARFSKAYSNSMGSYSSKYIYDNTFVRLRNVSIGYTLPSSILKKMKFSSFRVYVQGDNLLTFGSAARRGTDPEQSISGTTSNRFPTTKSVTFGLQFSL